MLAAANRTAIKKVSSINTEAMDELAFFLWALQASHSRPEGTLGVSPRCLRCVL